MWEREIIELLNGHRYEVHMQRTAEPTDSGIHGGRIQRMSVRNLKKNSIVFSFCGDFDCDARTTEEKTVIDYILAKFN